MKIFKIILYLFLGALFFSYIISFFDLPSHIESISGIVFGFFQMLFLINIFNLFE